MQLIKRELSGRTGSLYSAAPRGEQDVLQSKVVDRSVMSPSCGEEHNLPVSHMGLLGRTIRHCGRHIGKGDLLQTSPLHGTNSARVTLKMSKVPAKNGGWHSG